VRRVLVIVCAAVSAQLGACGYSMSSAYRDDVKTIAVPMFQNSTYSHGLEVTLTDALIQEIHRVTPWRVAPVASAETQLRGAITGTRLRRLSRQTDSGLSQEMAVELEVSFEWKQMTTGEVLVSRRRFRSSDTFVPSPGAQERLGFGEQSAVERMAKDIVAELRSSW